MFTRRDLARIAAGGGAAGALAAPSRAASPGAVTIHPLVSSHVPGELKVAIYRPPDYDRQRAEAYPLLLLLHGGNGSEQHLLYFKSVFDAEILAGRLPPLVIATPSSRRSLYMDYRDGSQRWEQFILADVLPFLRRSEHVAQGRTATFIGGWSMGGLGALRIAFKHPQLFAAVAALEPAIEPTLTWRGVGPETRFWRPETALYPAAIRSTPTTGRPTTPRPSPAAHRIACWTSASISRSAIRTCCTSTKAWSSFIVPCSMRGSRTSTAWCTGQSMSDLHCFRAWRTR